MKILVKERVAFSGRFILFRVPFLLGLVHGLVGHLLRRLCVLLRLQKFYLFPLRFPLLFAFLTKVSPPFSKPWVLETHGSSTNGWFLKICGCDRAITAFQF